MECKKVLNFLNFDARYAFKLKMSDKCHMKYNVKAKIGLTTTGLITHLFVA